MHTPTASTAYACLTGPSTVRAPLTLKLPSADEWQLPEGSRATPALALPSRPFGPHQVLGPRRL